MNIYNEDCISCHDKIQDQSVDLMICDPPFGLNESTFDKHYKRQKNIIEGYQEAPKNYYQFSYDWISRAKRKLKKNGSMYIISGWSNIDIIGSVLRNLDFYIINKLIWHFNFGVFTKNKYNTSHYEIYYVKKTPEDKPVFNTYCRYSAFDKDEQGRSLLFEDMSSVWHINKEFSPQKIKNQNKLPEDLIRKMILYSSNRGDVVCDFFLGNFTTAIVAKKLGRLPCGFEINKNSFILGMKRLEETRKEKVIFEKLPEEEFILFNQGKKLSQKTIQEICDYFEKYCGEKTKKQIIEELIKIHGRGKFSIKNILDKYCSKTNRDRKKQKITIIDLPVKEI